MLKIKPEILRKFTDNLVRFEDWLCEKRDKGLTEVFVTLVHMAAEVDIKVRIVEPMAKEGVN